MRKISTLLIFFVAAVIAGGAAFAGAADPNTEWSGDFSDQKEEFIKVVDTPGEWSELWQRAFKKPAPAVDFEKNVVACVFLGHFAAWHYDIDFDGPRPRDGRFMITYSLHDVKLQMTGPFKAEGQYRMRVFEKPKNAASIVLEEAGSTSRIKKRK